MAQDKSGQDTTKLAVDRTRLSHERTLMAWVRTAVSLITFGFAIDRFGEQHPKGRHALLGAHNFSLVMISIGLAALVLATLQHRRNVTALERDSGKRPFSTVLVLAALIAGLGILGLLAVIFR